MLRDVPLALFWNSPPFFKEGLGVVTHQDKKNTEGSYEAASLLIKAQKVTIKNRYYLQQKSKLGPTFAVPLWR
jgi:hypothetical protein